VLNLAFFAAALSTVMWGVIFSTYHIENPLLFWLPTANVVGVALALYVDSDTAELVSSVAGIEQYKYSLKGV
jgi:hypothetical protein